MATPSAVKKGLTTIIWGTSGILGSPSSAIVASISVTPHEGGPVGVIENGDGARVGKIYISESNGFDADVECVYDTALTWPAVGDTVALTLPKVGAAGGTVAMNCTLEFITPQQARKKEAMIKMKMSYDPGVVA